MERQPADTSLGGLAGGLFGLFHGTGKLVITALIGGRLGRGSTRTQRVLIGGVVSFAPLLGGLLTFWEGRPSVRGLLNGLTIGAFAGGTAAAILLLFVHTIEKRQHRQKDEAEHRATEEQKSGEPKQSFKERFAEAYQEEKERGKQMEKFLSSQFKKTESNPKNK